MLITGAGGSIGSEIARQVAAVRPVSLLLLDHDETHLHDAAADVGTADAIQVLADIRDDERVAEVFARYRPEVVFHAAAHKHVPLLEAHPVRGGAHQRARHAQRARGALPSRGVERFVFISTDKAVQPGSVMGAIEADRRADRAGRSSPDRPRGSAPSASATCSAAAAASSRPSSARSPPAAR